MEIFRTAQEGSRVSNRDEVRMSSTEEVHAWSGSAWSFGLIRCSRWLCMPHAEGKGLACKVLI